MTFHLAIISEHASPIAELGGVDSGGQNVYVAQIAKHLAKLGFAVDVFTRRDSADGGTVVETPSGYRVYRVPAGPARYVPKEELLQYMPSFADWMARHIRRGNRYAVVHANFWMSGLVGCRLKQAFGIPLVTTFHALGRVRLRHQGLADRFPPERIETEERIMRESDCLIAECPQDEDDQIRLYGADPSKIRIVGCGFDGAEFCPTEKTIARRKTQLPFDERLIVHIGRMVPRKGVDNVIRALAVLVQRTQTPTRLVIVGGENPDPAPVFTPEIGRLKELAESLGISHLVHFTGARGRDVLRFYYSAADVFVTTPWYEPFGITPLEAMACGTPVIGSRVGGIKYTVADGETGYLVPPRNPTAVADGLERLLNNPDLRLRMGENAIRRVNRHFTWRQIASEIADVYRDAAADVVHRGQAAGARVASTGVVQ